MDILKKKDYDKCERDGFELNQEVFFNRKNKKSKILAIDTSGDDDFKFFIEDGEGDFLKNYTSGCGTKESLDKKGTWCTKRDISRIAKPANDKSVRFNIEDHIDKYLSLCAETNDEKAKYFKYKGRVFFVKAVDGTELGFYKLSEVEKEKDAEAVIIMFNERASEMRDLYNTIIALNPYRKDDILECIVEAMNSIEDLMTDFSNRELIVTFISQETKKAVLIKI